MRRINEQTSRAFGLIGLRHLQDERGVMLVLTMVILLVISSLAATNIINAYLERSLARNQLYASVSLNAADAGVDYGLTWLNDPVNAATIPDHTVTPGWTQTLTGSLPSGGDYAVTLRFKTEDEFYTDGDGANGEVVLYNSCSNSLNDCWGFPGSVYDNPADPAQPIVEIEAGGTYGSAGSRTVTLDVARNGLEVKAYGAITAGSSVTTTGNITVDGRGHDETGALCSGYNDPLATPPVVATGSCTACNNPGDNYPGITVDDGMSVDIDGSTDADGDGGSDAPISSVGGGGLSVPVSPDDALGLPDGTLAGMLSGLPAAGNTKTNGNITYMNADYHWNMSGTTTGIIIVSNPLFNPVQWKVSVPTIPDPADINGPQIVNPNLDSTHGDYSAALNADYDSNKNPHLQDTGVAFTTRPRNIDQQSNGTHKGVIIADSIDDLNGNIIVIGAMISLSALDVNKIGAGSAEVLFSCDAINVYTAQGYSTKLAWRRKFN